VVKKVLLVAQPSDPCGLWVAVGVLRLSWGGPEAELARGRPARRGTIFHPWV